MSSKRADKKRRAKRRPAAHHNVYVVELDPEVGTVKRVMAANPDAEPSARCFYVGMTGLSPGERFENYRCGYKANSVVRRCGRALCPELYEELNPIPYERAAEMERQLAAQLRKIGCVTDTPDTLGGGLAGSYSGATSSNVDGSDSAGSGWEMGPAHRRSRWAGGLCLFSGSGDGFQNPRIPTHDDTHADTRN